MDTVLMNITSWIISGAFAGWMASIIIGRNAQMGALAHIIVGIVGAMIGGVNANVLRVGGYGLNLPALVIAILGALALLFLVGLVRRRSDDYSRMSAQKVQSSRHAGDQTKIETPIDSAPPVSRLETPSTDPQGPATPSVESAASPNIQPQNETGSVPTGSASETKSGVVFLSYRRTDSTHVSGRIYDRLTESFGKASVFKDVDSIPLGLDFKEYLDHKVSECDVLLAVIGDRWLNTRDFNGTRRLEDPADFVRIEIESALTRDIPVIPLLIDGAPMPSQEELPASLRKLAYRNGILIRPDPDFHRDMDRLISALKRYILPNA